ncbi:hypothetical protein [Paenibacillus elgii]|uniref:hypothetical protein n=1 Tax=Paenibacillus elgii TaxID=189691 RepID=UPI0013D013B4|nr:hypothetical protein [Paenibacillus elgii]
MSLSDSILIQSKSGGIMEKFIEFRNFETLLNNRAEFVKMISNICDGDDFKNLKKTIKVLKSVGFLINPYPGNHKYEKLVNDVEKVITSFPDKQVKKDWDELREQANVINSLFQECYESQEYIDAEKIPREIELESFLITLEIMLTTLKNEEQPLSINLNFEHAFLKHDSVPMSVRKMFDYFSNISGSILNYLMFYKKTKNPLELDLVIDEAVILNSIKHFTAYDKINLLKDFVDYWKYHDCKIIKRDKYIAFEPKGKAAFLGNDISLERFESRRQQINIELEHIDFDAFLTIDDTVKLPPEGFLNKDEIITYHSFQEYFYLNNLNQKVLEVPIREWIRAFTILKELGRRFIEKRQIIKGNLHLSSVCLHISDEELKNKLISSGINQNNIVKIINNLTFSKSDSDLFDTPLIRVGNNGGFILVPSLISSMDSTRVLMCNFLKRDSNMDFKGYGFEQRVIEDLQEMGISAGGLNAKGFSDEGTERTFQCDVAFVIEKSLFLCECKAFSQPTTHRGFYELIEKKEKAVNIQLKAISKFYENNLQVVRTKLQLPSTWVPDRIVNILIVTPPVGSAEKIENTYIIDYSAFSKFINRDKPGIIAITKKVKYEFNIFPELKGEITTEKLIKFLKKPIQVQLERSRRRRINKEIPYGKYNLRLFDYETKFDDKISLEDENLEKYLKKLGKTYFKRK